MIETENKIITLLSNYLSTHLEESVSISSDLEYIPESFPHVSIVESDNINYEGSIDTHSNENHVQVLIDINVYTDDANGRKTHAKQIAEVIDEIMLFKGFNRISRLQIPNDKLYRLNIRYQGIVDENFNVFRR